MQKEKTSITLGFACLTLVSVVLFMVVGMVGFKIKLPTMLFFSWLIVIPFASKLGIAFSELQTGAFDMIRKGMEAIIIILAVGALTGAWIASGTVPALIYAGLKIMSPKFFLLTSLFLCSIVSLATGTSWGTIATAGLAVMGIGAGMGIPPGITAGAIISGAFFGDKMSPLSDTTNMASAIAGTDVITHVKHMLYTTVPSYIISAIIFLVIGLKYGSANTDMSNVETLTGSLSGVFNVGFIAFLPAILVLTLLVMQKSPITSILLGAVAGVLVAVLYQGVTLNIAAGTLYKGFSGEFGNAFLDKLLNRGGMLSMNELITVMIGGLGLGGMLRETGVLPTILKSISKKIHSVGGVVVATIATSYVCNAVGGSQAFTHVMTGTLMEPLFVEFRLKPQNLSRVMEDAGTMGAPLIPWHGSSVYCASMLQVSYSAFVPYCFLSFLCPIFSLIYGFTGFSMVKYTDEEIKNTKISKNHIETTTL